MTTAIFVMEIGIDNRIPTYSGGLGVLAGDMAYSFADLGLPATFVTLLSRNGYTSQKLDAETGQIDAPQQWDWEKLLSPLDARATVEIGDRKQTICAWEYRIRGNSETSVLFLNSDYPGNDPAVREATDRLYGGDPRHRLLQDIILGIGGYRMLKVLGLEVGFYHLNESHAAFATTELLRDTGDVAATRRRCAFTTHTPIPAGNDVFPLPSVEDALRDYPWVNWRNESVDGTINLSRLASKYCGVTNAVSMKHKFVSDRVVGRNEITYVTNGVYHRRWVHPELRKVFDSYIPGWEESPSLLVRALALPPEAMAQAHTAAKRGLLSAVNQGTWPKFDEDTLTISVAKRITGYKRNGMILSDPARLQRVAEESGSLQVIVAGKAHPRDGVAKGMLGEILRKADVLNRTSKNVRVAVLENYDMDMAKVLVAGSDVWLNNPRRPLEACGTSGIKAAMNGVLNLSVNDGWWLEGGLEGVNGWGVGRRTDWADLGDTRDGEDEEDLYRKLSKNVLPVFYRDHPKWIEMQKSSIATVGPLFNSYRMVEDYVTKVYSIASGTAAGYGKP